MKRGGGRLRWLEVVEDRGWEVVDGASVAGIEFVLMVGVGDGKGVKKSEVARLVIDGISIVVPESMLIKLGKIVGRPTDTSLAALPTIVDSAVETTTLLAVHTRLPPVNVAIGTFNPISSYTTPASPALYPS